LQAIGYFFNFCDAFNTIYKSISYRVLVLIGQTSTLQYMNYEYKNAIPCHSLIQLIL